MSTSMDAVWDKQPGAQSCRTMLHCWPPLMTVASSSSWIYFSVFYVGGGDREMKKGISVIVDNKEKKRKHCHSRNHEVTSSPHGRAEDTSTSLIPSRYWDSFYQNLGLSNVHKLYLWMQLKEG
ncbi:hypothetical protein C4D60_Mb10t12390 [Musa balbisiana]|uniref:Uncharacterized protein n=1 Tax=Musa balbisiana TaxID=52838 RepID=A0A4S8IXY6_MUSBA|nr:hypothetical protein C4D60_Mb10t12390 [Musa balbisiana]